MAFKNISFLVPVGVRDMKLLDREKFLRNIRVPILKVVENNLPKIINICKPYFLKLENFKPVVSLETNNEYKKCIHLNPELVNSWCDIKEKDRTSLKEQNISEQNFDMKDIQITYENWSYDKIFKAVLPKDDDIVSGFSQIGHIIHLNLREHLLEYKTLIGQVLLDKIKTCRTVVNKNNIIDNTYRNFSMEVIAGDEDFLVTVKENNCKFQFDFSKVYWNPRLCKEHERIINIFNPGDALFDVFCGVGPFSIPAAKKKCQVFANDLNPESVKWLRHNEKLNKIKPSYFQSFQLDGKDFILDIIKNNIISLANNKEFSNSGNKIHITMNLPALAVEFLKYFNKLIDNEHLTLLNCDIILHVYCFVVGDNCVELAKKTVCDGFGRDVSKNMLEVHNVRNVSPKKEMMRVVIKLTIDILEIDNFEPPTKKILYS